MSSDPHSLLLLLSLTATLTATLSRVLSLTSTLTATLSHCYSHCYSLSSTLTATLSRVLSLLLSLEYSYCYSHCLSCCYCYSNCHSYQNLFPVVQVPCLRIRTFRLIRTSPESVQNFQNDHQKLFLYVQEKRIIMKDMINKWLQNDKWTIILALILSYLIFFSLILSSFILSRLGKCEGCPWEFSQNIWNDFTAFGLSFINNSKKNSDKGYKKFNNVDDNHKNCTHNNNNNDNKNDNNTTTNSKNKLKSKKNPDINDFDASRMTYLVSTHLLPPLITADVARNFSHICVFVKSHNFY